MAEELMSQKGMGMHHKNLLKRILNMKEMGVILPTLLFVIVIQCINPVFLSWDNIVNVLRATGFTLITALGMTLVLVSGGLDLSIGSVLAVGSTLCGVGLTAGLPIPISLVVGIVSGLLLGMVNGLIIVHFKIPPLIMTLGMLYMARGIVYIITQGTPIYPLPKAFQAIEQEISLGIPNVVYISLILALVLSFILKNTVFGRKVYAIGGNTEAARLSGINIGRTYVSIYALTGALAALTGVIQASRLGSAQPSAGTGYELTVIAAVIIGGTSTYGGVGTILGTTVGALFMNILTNSMMLMRVSAFWQNLVIGFILILAVIIDQLNRERKFKSTLKN